MNIYLVRHAQSEANIDYNVLKSSTNMSIGLSNLGKEQARENGDFLSTVLESKSKIKIWNSPYNRTRQTSSIIKEVISSKNIQFSESESIYLSERQFGLVDDVDNYIHKYPDEAKHYNLHKESNHDFFARPPLGESPFDMCLRLDFFLKTILKNSKEETHVIVSHGAAIRGLIMMHQNLSYETYNSPNPYNASVNLISEDKLIGTIFTPSKKTS